MRRFASLLIGLVALTAAAWADPPVLIFDEKPSQSVPRHFRRCDTPVDGVNREGLATLRCSGSAQYGASELDAIAKQLALPEVLGGSRVVAVDLRQESHGFVNGRPVSWYGPGDQANRGKSRHIVQQDEASRLDHLFEKGSANIATIVTKVGADEIGTSTVENVAVKSVEVESDLTASRNFGYERIPVNDHFAPDPAAVDRFVAFVRALPAAAWLHFHCHAGDGRTTSFMSMYDMMRNAKRVPFEEIIRRQFLLGGSDLAKMPAKTSWKHDAAVGRLAFLRRFHAYCQTDFSVPWSVWATNK